MERDITRASRPATQVASSTGTARRVAMVGTFDVENLGDLLFPFVASHELSARLGVVELELFSYRAFDPPLWPFAVRPVHTLAPRLGEFDLVVIGGGHLVRGDADVAPGYEPTVDGTTHPYGLWLTPTLLAECAGVPVVWNALGALDSVARTHDVLVEAALGSVDYLAVRDLESARVVRALHGGATPVVVPDTIYGIAPLLDEGVREMARKTLASLGVTGPYVVVQPSQVLERYRDGVDAVAAAARADGLCVLELPCGPCHHDRVGRLSLTPPTTHVEPWPEPLVTAAILSEAEAVVASSLHAGIIATTFGVPLHRPRALVGSKHEPLDALPGVTQLPHDGDDTQAVARFGRVTPGVEVTSHRAALQHHWDEVARHCVGRGTRGPRDGVAELLERLPTLLAARDREARAQLHALARAHEVERHRSHAEVAELLARLEDEHATSDQLREVLARRSVRGALGVADAWGAMRRGRGVTRDPRRDEGGPTRAS